MKNRAPLHFWVGLLLFVQGSLVLMGWALQAPDWVRLRPNHIAMVINTALCFALVGMGLIAPIVAPGYKSTLQVIVGWLVLLLPALVLLQILARQDFGIDWYSLHAWLQDGNSQPGRMAIIRR